MQRMRKRGVEGQPRRVQEKELRQKLPEPRENEQTMEGRDPTTEHLERTIPFLRNSESLGGAFQPPLCSGHARILQLSRSRVQSVTQSCAGSRREGL